MTARTVLQQADIARALTRISHEILESNRGSSNLVLLGIPTRGVILAQRIAAVLNDIEPSSAVAGPPGRARTHTKSSRLSPNRIGMSSRSRRTMNLTMGGCA